MAIESYSIKMDGYWPEAGRGNLINGSGVYCVYSCTADKQGGITINRLIYIGESSKVRLRVLAHEKLEIWKKYLLKGNVLYFSCGPIFSGRERAEAAMINKHVPPANKEYTEHFPFDTTKILLTEEYALLHKKFTVYR